MCSESNPNKPLKIFISYSHKDEDLKNELEKHLAGLKREKLIESWHFRMIMPGTEWGKEIDEHLEKAHIILLLISPDFMASDYCYDIEVKRALERHEAGEARVIPIILRPTDWETTPFNRLQALPKDAKPIDTWQNINEAFLNVVKEMRKVIGLLKRSYSVQAPKKSIHPSVPPRIPTTLPSQEKKTNLQLSSSKQFPKANRTRNVQKKTTMNRSKINKIQFVNRLDEIKLITTDYPATYLLINAPMGYGKTILLESIKTKFPKKDFFCIHITLSRKRRYTFKELASLIYKEVENKPFKAKTLSKPDNFGHKVGLSILKRLNNTKIKNVLIMIDEAETLSKELISPFLNQFIPAIQQTMNAVVQPIQLRFIISGRYISNWQQFATEITLESMSLTPFYFEAVFQTVDVYNSRTVPQRRRQFLREFAAHLMYFTAGHPGCMAQILDTDFESLIEPKEIEYYNKFLEPIIIELEHGIPNQLKDIFNILSVVRRYNSRLLQHFIKKGLIEWSESEHELEKLFLQTYLVDKKYGFLTDDMARRLFAIRLRRNHFDKFIQVCKESISFYETALKDAEAFRPDIIACELLFQKVQYFFYKEKGDEKKFVQSLTKIFEHLKTGNQAKDKLESLKEILNSDWEFRFNFNYLLNKRKYNDVTPFNQLIDELDNLIKNC